ncbi:hypothetical protein H6P81_019956 [Aristolochia fimbriata]|uniref:Cytochrome P450 n=1 Tax=Aristolochia fimbriata TaxID=158543 RepID=A0AAV7DUD6_ARIFI|nr:hypothetical protein H6P81_019956 [Aristolochia fimbriata]
MAWLLLLQATVGFAASVILFWVFLSRSNWIAGEKGEGRKFKKAIERFFQLLVPSIALDAIPLLGWVDWGGMKKDMKRTAAEMDSVLSVWLEEHKMREKKRGKDSGEEEEADFMDVMLSRVKELQQIEGGYDEDTVVKATCLALIIGGTDTTSVSLAWVLCFTLSHPDVLKKVQDELATHVGDRRNVEEADLKNLVYLQAVVKETLRFAPAVGFVVTHEAMEECAVGGFRVPAGTRLLVNLRKMQLDPAVWGGDGNDDDDDPSEFRPERFLTGRGAGVDVRGQHFECIPFGSGRRMCPGLSFALRVIHLVLARMVHGFEMKMNISEEEDWKKRLRIAADPSASDVKVLLTPRLPSQLYE